MDTEATIIITVKKTETGYSSNCQIEGIDELTAACILIDIGRDILARLASHHHEGGNSYAPPASDAATIEEARTNGH